MTFYGQQTHGRAFADIFNEWKHEKMVIPRQFVQLTISLWSQLQVVTDKIRNVELPIS